MSPGNSADTGSLVDRVALVTGGGGAIGRAASLEMASAGADIAIVDIDATGGEQTAAEVRALGRDATFIRADVSDAAQVRGYVDSAMDRYARIDVFFNNAAVEGVLAPITEYPLDMFDRLFAINVRGVFLGMQAVLSVMLQQSSGSIINTASLDGLMASPSMAPYGMSKHAVIGLTRSAAIEVARNGIRVNAVCPGPIDTRMMQSVDRMIDAISNPHNPGESRQTLTSRQPLGRYGMAVEVAKVVRFLASDAASFVTGAAWTVDGGRSVL